ncbi:uncharacterized protein YecT (DUF1311 family) [Roseibium hamelinense]|uniref:Uncharacterized protein YecT (DUF1311 family) n=1 Tax=Roseibium hamelinense TaxID=150831 RepID=A0A562SNV4_9HYPH|nr:lysozyme inhibitor LprI family protein [Roseibium hamelinense]MTI44010.1 DUF1311 domain-containing protein [Roseibium hamelinense]TWI82783.1 uncharacterized protein YecT (DUF1311 family) [Roseibium hamelinense]
MFRKAVIIIGFAVSLPAGNAAAQKSVDCKSPETQTDMNHCAAQDWKAADGKLNEAYKKAMASMKKTDSYLPKDQKGAADTLRDAQRDWIPFRDKACASYGFLARGGTMEPMLVANCKTEVTQQRTKQLEELAQGLGN